MHIGENKVSLHHQFMNLHPGNSYKISYVYILDSSLDDIDDHLNSFFFLTLHQKEVADHPNEDKLGKEGKSL